VAYLRLAGLRCNCYVDDFFLAASAAEITDHRDLLCDVLAELGLCINELKSHLEPLLLQEYIGYMVSTKEVEPRVSMPKKRISALRHDIRRVLQAGHCVARTLARISRCTVSRISRT